MSGPSFTVRSMHHPYDELSRLPHIDLVWHFGGRDGFTRWHGDGSCTISLNWRALQCVRRSTLTHEIRHVLLGEPPAGAAAKAREELAVEIETARLLMPLDRLIDVRRWSRYAGEIAEELCVDRQLVLVRLKYLTDDEARQVREAVESMEEAA